jgi:O-antigen/teichoic acid export membrane protein
MHMRRFEKIQFINNVGSSWFALGINVAVGIFLSPFILHRLGDSAFGIWVLIFSITGYYGLFDLGIRSSIVRYASKFTATGDKEELAKLINTSLFIYGGVGVLSLLITIVLFVYVDSIFRVPAELHATARWLLLMVGASVAFGFPLGVFGGFLDGLQRFDVNNWTSVASNLLRAGLIVAALDNGRGLLTIALITVVLPLITSLVRGIFAFRIHPVALGLKYVDRATFRMMASYSGVTLIIMIAGRLKFKTDTIVIGTMLSAAAITYFNIAGRIVDYAGEIVTSLAQNFLPMASQSEAKGSMEHLRKVFVTGNRLCAFTIFPVTAVLLILGKSIIEVWVGRQYIATSYNVLVILIIPSTLMWAQAASGRVLFGISKHRTWAFVTLAEGISNLILSILLVRPYGIVGDALGTAIPLTCSMVFFMPGHLCKQLGIRLWTYLREAFVLPIVVSTPLVLVLLLMRRWFVAHNYWQLGIQLFVGAIAYGLGLAWVFFTSRALRVGQLADIEEMRPFDAGLVASAVEDV